MAAGQVPPPGLPFFFRNGYMSDMRILIIEDDRDAAAYLVKAFRESGHVADSAADGVTGYDMAREGQHDVVIVDRMLPKMDGLSLIGALRAQGVETPVLILSALGQVDDRVKGLRAGGDDYLSKPYSFSELLARVEVLARRRGKGVAEETTYRTGDLELDRLSHKVTRAGGEIVLQPREFRLLGGDAHDAAGACLGLSFRPADQRHRRSYVPPARQDRQGFRDAAAAHRARRRIHDP
jgi:two-component system OmpR family response regulator